METQTTQTTVLDDIQRLLRSRQRELQRKAESGLRARDARLAAQYAKQIGALLGFLHRALSPHAAEDAHEIFLERLEAAESALGRATVNSIHQALKTAPSIPWPEGAGY